VRLLRERYRTSTCRSFIRKDFENLIFSTVWRNGRLRHERVRDSGVERVLFTEAQIDARIRDWPRSLAQLRGRTSRLVGVLKVDLFSDRTGAPHRGAVKVDFPGDLELLDKSVPPGVVRIAKDLDEEYRRRGRCYWWRTSSIPASRCATCC